MKYFLGFISNHPFVLYLYCVTAHKYTFNNIEESPPFFLWSKMFFVIYVKSKFISGGIIMSNIRFDNNETIEEQYLSLPRAEIQKAIMLKATDTPEQTLMQVRGRPGGALSAQNNERANPKPNIFTRKAPINSNVLTDLQHASPDFRKDAKKMLEAISRNHNAFEYADESLQRDPNFLIEAIKRNPAVYAHIPLETKMDPEFQRMFNGHLETLNSVYRDTMLRTVTEIPVNGDKIHLPKQQVDKDYPWDMEDYKKALQENCDTVLQDPTSAALLSESRKLMCMVQLAATQNPSLRQQINTAETEFYTSPEQREKALSVAETESRMHAGADAYLKKMEDMNPELIKQIEQKQEAYWLQTRYKAACAEMTDEQRKREAVHRLQRDMPLARLGKAYAHQDRMSRSHRFDRDEDMDRDAEKTIKEAERRVKDQKARQECLDYLKFACRDYINSLVSDGRISQEDASLCIGLIDSIPSVTKASYTYTNFAQASINDFDNGDFHMSPVEVDALKRAIVLTDAQQKDIEERIHATEREAQQRIQDSHLLRAHPEYDRAQTQEIHMSRGKK